jgi:hypothetical protein
VLRAVGPAGNGGRLLEEEQGGDGDGEAEQDGRRHGGVDAVVVHDRADGAVGVVIAVAVVMDAPQEDGGQQQDRQDQRDGPQTRFREGAPPRYDGFLATHVHK